MSSQKLHHVTGRLSLRPPQAESLAKLKRARACTAQEFVVDAGWS